MDPLIEPPAPRPRLRLGVRIGVFVVGWILILVGVAGLVLPGIQGVFTIVTGAALLSLDNELIYRLMRRAFLRWPHLWDRIERLREKTHERLHRLFRRNEK
ncbi:MAG: PGPGW domain-containing protein [Acidobacteriota bacterium]